MALILKLWEMWSTISMPLLPGPLRVVVTVRVSSISKIELFNHSIVCKQMTDIELLVLYRNTWNYFTVCKWMTFGLLKMLPTNYSFTDHISVLDMTLNYLMVRLQSWSFGECAVPLQCHYSQVHSDLEW